MNPVLLHDLFDHFILALITPGLTENENRGRKEFIRVNEPFLILFNNLILVKFSVSKNLINFETSSL